MKVRSRDVLVLVFGLVVLAGIVSMMALFSSEINELKRENTALIGQVEFVENNLDDLRATVTEKEKSFQAKEIKERYLLDVIVDYEIRMPFEREEGYASGFAEGEASTAPKKPTYQEMLDMLVSNKYEVFALSQNVCTILAMDARERWRNEGWRVGVASVFFWGEGGHLVIVFDTIDKGEVFVDLVSAGSGNALTFREIKVEIGKSFTELNKSVYTKPSFNDTITEVKKMW